MRHAAPRGHALEQDARDLAAVQKQIVRPFQREGLGAAGERDTGIEEREGGNEGAQGDGLGRLGRMQQERGREIAGGIGPWAAAAPARGGLAVGEDPGGAGQRIRAAQRLGIGAVDLVEDEAGVAVWEGHGRLRAATSARTDGLAPWGRLRAVRTMRGKWGLSGGGTA